MKKAAIVFILLGGMALVMLLLQDPKVRAQADKQADHPAEDSRLLSRVEALEDMVSFHTHEQELKGLHERLLALESSRAVERPLTQNGNATRDDQTRRFERDLSEVKREVQSLSSKLSDLERSVTPLRQDITSLRRAVTRVESSLVRIDLRQ